MFDDDFYLYLLFLAISVGIFFFVLFLCVCNKLPDEIKDTNCIYYKEQIYCLKENQND